jgi:hypothetical protein
MSDEIISGEISTPTPTAITLPVFDAPPKFAEYFEFAHEFDQSQIEDWDLTRARGIEIHDAWIETGTFPEDLSLLRGVLLIQVRISRFVEGFPGKEDMPYFDALVAKVRHLMSEASE